MKPSLKRTPNKGRHQRRKNRGPYTFCDWRPEDFDPAIDRLAHHFQLKMSKEFLEFLRGKIASDVERLESSDRSFFRWRKTPEALKKDWLTKRNAAKKLLLLLIPLDKDEIENHLPSPQPDQQEIESAPPGPWPYQPPWIVDLYPMCCRRPAVGASDLQALRRQLEDFISDCDKVLSNPELGIQKSTVGSYVGHIDEDFVFFMSIRFQEATGRPATNNSNRNSPGAFSDLLADVYKVAIGYMPHTPKQIEHDLRAVRKRHHRAYAALAQAN
jgi:hypothetical protein